MHPYNAITETIQRSTSIALYEKKKHQQLKSENLFKIFLLTDTFQLRFDFRQMLCDMCCQQIITSLITLHSTQKQQRQQQANVFVTKAKLRVPTFFRTDANRDDAKNSASCCNESAIDYNFVFRS
jgi:hypothetical protein